MNALLEVILTIWKYTGFQSVVLLAMCDANYCLALVDVGCYGKDSDATIFNGSFVGKGFASGELDIPHPENVIRHKLSFAIVADAILL